MEYNVGQFLKVDEVIYEIVGKIQFRNYSDNCTWFEYRLLERFGPGERWLSIDDKYREYSISWNEIVGKIQFRNYSDNCTWFEYRLLERFGPGERWLSIDDKYREYSISWTAGELSLDGYHQVDKGIREVVSVSGDVDVVVGDSASFCEYEDKTEENIISVEQWDDIKEFSRGYYLDNYLDKNEICFANTSDASNFSTNSSNPSASSRNGKKRINPFFVIGIAMLLVFAIGFIGNMIGGKSIAKFLKKSNQFTYVTSITGNDGEKADVYESSLSKEDTVMTIIESVDGNVLVGGKSIAKFLKKSNQFTYVTSITGNDGEKADVYESSLSKEDTVMTIIEAVDGNVLDVEEDKTQGSESIAILTEDEYCMVYISVSNEVLVQISNRKYAYTSDKEPYHSSAHTHSYYRRYYYSAAYLGDARRYRRHHSPYENYNGERLDTDMPYHSSAHTHSYYRRYYYSAAYLGDARRYRRHHSPYENYNGERLDTDMFDQYDSYSDSIKRNSVNSRTSSGGGLSSGK